MFKRNKRFEDNSDWDLDSISGRWSHCDEWDSHQKASTSKRPLFWILAGIIISIAVLFTVTTFLRPVLENEQLLAETAVTGPSVSSVTPVSMIQADHTIVPDPFFSGVLSATLTHSESTEAMSYGDYLPRDLGLFMLDLINEDRITHGLSPVAWDTVAATAGQHHADDMVAHNYFSHWNLQGVGPEHRYTQVGGTHIVFENLHSFSYTYENGLGAVIENWPAVIENAQLSLMSSPGHRDNILNPTHTHVGIGMAYNAATGQFRLAQMFTGQYVELERPLPIYAQLGQTIIVQGYIRGEDISNALLNIAYEPFPDALSTEQLDQTGAYVSSAVSIETRPISLTFDENIILDHNSQLVGYYHIRIFVDFQNNQSDRKSVV